MDFVFPTTPASVPVHGSSAYFPVHRIYCVGQNYDAHAKEMGATGRAAPFFFMKPADAVMPVADNACGTMPYPSQTQNLHHEIELVVAIGKTGAHIDVKDAPDFVWGYAVGLDMTRRDLQAESKAQGRPWSTAKGFDFSAPISPITPIAQCGWLSSAAISLEVNGVRKQDSNIDQLIWNVAEVIAALSTFFTLKEGDLIFTGTPAGVGAVVKGDLMRGEIAGLGSLQVSVA
ncbi:MAG: fumarylacetoacetate hydrolase family protein [Burkholderiaceae bacterium]|nr:fumarylacetoacetate hydrolase family protein [Burkholderiaceae bacterium]